MALRYLTAGESHGPALNAILEGLPAGLNLDEDIIAIDLARRQSGAGSGDRMAIEKDRASILAGLMEGKTTGAPLSLLIKNRDHANWKGKSVAPYVTPRPGHADLPAAVKYGYDDVRPSLERASARETAARVAIGAVCRALLKVFGISVDGYVTAIAGINANSDLCDIDELIERARRSKVQCPDERAAEKIERAIEVAHRDGETLGGIIEVVVRGLPAGIGSHVEPSRRLDVRLAAAIIGMNAIKGIEIGDAFANAAKSGTKAQDPIYLDGKKLIRKTNRCGGIEGGISNGENVWLRAAMKPIPTTRKGQNTVDLSTGAKRIATYERSDICPVPRAVVVAESLVAFVIADALTEKLGGDSLEEMLPRFENLRKATIDDVKMSSGKHVFWP
ncbi:MAG: chorismate synthase [Kiritimatiellia bacterium]